ncbi:MAG TPA: trypsin-like peptidase domain-containing protein [Longimicrobium sp.]|nr:trypsin-like peptidase domain-containing protein [Longimicrobium sp.]
MAAELHVLSGERAGLVIALSGAECAVGRHPGSALRFGAEAERGVSARHAVVVRDGAGWLLRDLGSTNGTWLNGRRVASDAVLRDGDRIVFGAAGPVVEFRHPDAAAPAPPPAASRRPRRTGARAASVAAAACALLVVGAGAYRLTRRPAPGPPAAEAGIRVEAAGGEVVVRTGALPARSRDPRPAAPPRRPSSAVPVIVAPSSARPAARPPGRDPVPRTNAPSPAVAPTRVPIDIRPAAPVPIDARPDAPPPGIAPAAMPAPSAAPRVVAVERRNRLAVARIYVEDQDGVVATGTAFAVRADGTLITSRHVVGGRPRRIAVQFALSSQRWSARVVAVSGEWDLAAVKVDSIVGAVPTVRGLNPRADTLAAGAPVMLVGFPRGSEPEEGTLPRPSLSPAAFAGVRGGRVDLHARSSVGASGSPVFDANGEVIAVLFGGSPRADPPLLHAVPASAVARLVGR